MDPRAKELIERLGLQPHPEGGYYSECFRSEVRVGSPDGERDAVTVIQLLLEGGACSRWHQVGGDEVWTYLDGAPLELFELDASGQGLERISLGRFDEGGQPLHSVAAGHWQAARSSGAFSLVACVVAPGFEFADFTLMSERPLEAKALRASHPDLASLL